MFFSVPCCSATPPRTPTPPQRPTRRAWPLRFSSLYLLPRPTVRDEPTRKQQRRQDSTKPRTGNGAGFFFVGITKTVSFTSRNRTMSSNQNPRITVVGYGSQGRAHALNLRDSGFDVTVGLRPGGPTEIQAKADGFEVRSPAEAVREADLVAVLTPDMVQKKLYEEVLAPNMRKGACLLFAHGLNV